MDPSLLIVFIILTGYAFYHFIAGREALSNLGLTAFIGTVQFFRHIGCVVLAGS